MWNQEVTAGQSVQLVGTQMRGRVLEVDPVMYVARVRVNGAGERWVRLDELRIIAAGSRPRSDDGHLGRAV